MCAALPRIQLANDALLHSDFQHGVAVSVGKRRQWLGRQSSIDDIPAFQLQYGGIVSAEPTAPASARFAPAESEPAESAAAFAGLFYASFK